MARLVRTTALQLLRRLPSHIQFDDLYSAGLFALVEAWRRFDGSRGIAFSDYVRTRVKGAMIDELRRGDPVTRHRRRSMRLGTERENMGPAPRLVELSAAASVADTAADPEHALARQQSISRMREAEARLPARLRLVLRLRMHDDWRLQAIADHLGVTEGRASQLVTEAISLLRRDMEP